MRKQDKWKLTRKRKREAGMSKKEKMKKFYEKWGTS